MDFRNPIIAIHLQTPCYEVTGGLQKLAQTMFAKAVMNGYQNIQLGRLNYPIDTLTIGTH